MLQAFDLLELDGEDLRPCPWASARLASQGCCSAWGIVMASLAGPDWRRPYGLGCLLGEFASRRLWRDPLNKPDNGATQFCIFDTHERLHQRQAIRRCKEIGHVGGRGSFSGPPNRWRDV
jgi:hypothetical protein